MTTYYVDNSLQGASDLNSGLTTSQAFQSLAALSSLTLAPGDVVALKSGTHYTGGLTVTASGTAAAPISFTTYGGTASASVANEGLWSNAISVRGASYVNFTGISVTGAHQAGYYVDGNSSHVTIQGADITNVGEGILLEGSSNLVAHNYVHDLHMVVNTPSPASDDYGANGVVISGVNNVISDNVILRAKAASYDWGSDGGAFELFGTVDGTQILNNWVQDSQGMLEVGGQPGHAYNITISGNVSYNNGDFAVLHNSGGQFGAQFSAFLMSQNTIIETNNTASSSSDVFLEGPATPNSISFNNNIVWMNAGDSVFKTVGSYHSGNVFNLLSSSTHIYNNWDNTLGPGEVLANPQFANLAALQLQPAANGPAAGKGANPTGGDLPVPTPAMLTPEPPNWTDLTIPATPNEPATQNPLILGHDAAVTHNTVLAITNLFSIADTTRSAVKYQFIDWNQNGHLLVNGVAQTHGEPIEVDAANLSSVSVYAGVGTDSIQVLAFDGTYWSGANVTVTGTNTPPVISVTPPSGVPNQSVPLSSLVSTSDHEGDPTVLYEIVDWNDEQTSGHFVVDSNIVAPSTPTQLTPAQLANATYVFGTTADNMSIRATDGLAWSDFSNVSSQPVSPIVIQTIVSQTANTGAAFNLSVASAFQDRNPGGTLAFTATLANGGSLPSWLKFQNGVFSGTPGAADSNASLDIVVVAADQGSVSTHFSLTTSAPPPPTVQAGNATPVAGSTVSAASLFTSTSSAPIQTYEFADWWNTPTSGRFAIAGVSQAQGSDLQVAAADLSKVTFLAGTSHDYLGIRVFDGANWSNWVSFNVDPVAANAPPVVTTHIGAQSATTGAAFNLNVTPDFSDPNPGDVLTMSATLASGAALPAWLHFTNGVFSGTPATTDAGTLQIKVTATDPSQAAVSDSFALTVETANQPPVVATQIPAQTAAAGAAFNLNVTPDFSDPNPGDVLTLTATLSNGASLPSWLHFTNGVFSGTPATTDAGTLQVKVTATDPSQAAVTDTFALTVGVGNQPPVVATAIPDQSAKSGTAFSLNVKSDFSDPNPGDVLTLSATLANGAALPTWLHFTNGAFSGTPASADIGTLQIKVTAADPSLAAVSDTFALTVAASPPVVGPVITAGDITPTKNSTLTAAQLFSASDATGTIQTYEIVDWWNTPNSGRFAISGVSQPQGSDLQIAATDLSKVTFLAGVSHDYLGVRAYDGATWSNWASFNVDPVAGNAPPVVATPIPDQSTKAGTAFSLNVTADFSDPNPGDALTLSATLASGAALPTWLHFSNGAFSGTPATTDAGTLQIKVTATDPSLAAVSDTFALTVGTGNQPPVVATPIADQTVKAGTAFNLNVVPDFSDPDPNDVLTLSATLASGVALPTWLHFTNGTFSGTPGSTDVGALQVKVTATDPSLAAVSDTFALTVGTSNQPPVVATHIGSQSATAGTAFSLNVTTDFSDPDAGDVLTLSATQVNGSALPTWLHFTNGTFSGTPGTADVGALQLKVTATDPSLAAVTDTFVLSVSASPPVSGPVVTASSLTPAKNATLTAAQLFSATDATGTIQTYELIDWWNVPTSGHFALAGVNQAQETDLQVAASDLSKVTFLVGTTHDYLGIRAFDGATWSNWASFNVDPV